MTFIYDDEYIMTYRQAHDAIIAELQSRGWTFGKPDLKVRHITSPTTKTRLWFKTQAIYYTLNPPHQSHMLTEARSLHVERECREQAAENVKGYVDRLLAIIVRWNGTTNL